jgi:hypothetical protein
VERFSKLIYVDIILYLGGIGSSPVHFGLENIQFIVMIFFLEILRQKMRHLSH